ncbi:MAG: hypothetical protein FWD23_00345 [Oscillospiraceae bacterium]|nr:hypothetical protein [Oscillospiraceae bacterium]
MLSLKPVKKYKPPKYPTQSEVNLSPALLNKLPPRWEKSVAVIAAAGMLGAIALTSCVISKSKNTGDNSESENYLNVAPIFVHGEGTGAIGCVMIVPPVFMSEQEALAIIKDEAKIGGLDFNADPPEYTATKNKTETKYSWDWQNKYVLGSGNVGLDLYDNKKGVAAAYIPMKSSEMLYPNGPQSSVTNYAPRELAKLTAEDFAQQKGDIALGVFYEPGSDWEAIQSLIEDYQNKTSKIYHEYYDEQNPDEYRKKYDEAQREYEAEIKLLAEEDLRAQVRDFIEWLQAQGII